MALALLGSGCFAHRPANELLPDAPVAVEFIHPGTVAAVGEPGDTLWLRDVTSLRGRLQRITRDTVYLNVTGASTRTGVNLRIPPDRRVTIARQPSVLVEGREFKPVLTAGLILGVTALVAVVAFAIALATWETAG